MSGINWDVVAEQAKRKAEEYAKRYEGNSFVAAYNGFFQGYMENAGEREGLRVINARLESEKATPYEVVREIETVSGVPPQLQTPPPEPTFSLNSFI